MHHIQFKKILQSLVMQEWGISQFMLKGSKGFLLFFFPFKPNMTFNNLI